MENNMDKYGNITLTQGDSFEFVVNDLPVVEGAKLFFAAQDEERNPVGNEVEVDILSSSTSVFLDADLTDLFIVSEDKKAQNYYYGLKLVYPDGVKRVEKTLNIGGKKIGDLNVITVYPRKVKGDPNV
jgi:DNA-binding cell septation regulator SpoVG